VRVALLAAALLLTACGGHRQARPRCSLAPTEAPTPATGEHTLAVRSTCAVAAHPSLALGGLPFTFVPEGGARGAHVVLFDKYRCDVRVRALAREVRVGRAELKLQASPMDWCPAEAASTVVHVYLGGKRTPATWRGVLRDVADGRLARVWPCGALRAALAHFTNGPSYSRLPQAIERAAAPACAAAVAGIRNGAPRLAVEQSLGAPDAGGPRCFAWRWQPGSGAVDGARVCFARGRATLVQTALHG
jgi:hypothetical protein